MYADTRHLLTQMITLIEHSACTWIQEGLVHGCWAQAWWLEINANICKSSSEKLFRSRQSFPTTSLAPCRLGVYTVSKSQLFYCPWSVVNVEDAKSCHLGTCWCLSSLLFCFYAGFSVPWEMLLGMVFCMRSCTASSCDLMALDNHHNIDKWISIKLTLWLSTAITIMLAEMGNLCL